MTDSSAVNFTTVHREADWYHQIPAAIGLLMETADGRKYGVFSTNIEEFSAEKAKSQLIRAHEDD